MIHAKLIPSIEKVFLDTPIDSLPVLDHIYAYRNHTVSFQIALRGDSYDPHRHFASIRWEGIPDEAVTLRQVDLVPSLMPASPAGFDAGYVRTAPGLYPDLLSPIQMRGCGPCCDRQTRTVWVDVDMTKVPQKKKLYDLNVTFTASINDTSVTMPLCIRAIPADLPENDFTVTQWFHCDALANYYNCEPFSERHWDAVEKFMKTAVKNGINTILTPLFTPPLDTYEGGERRTTQLIGIRKYANGRYKFDFSDLDRWIDTADRAGVKNFEISHLFTQWGAAHAPKIMATTPNGYEKIFGWETNATGREYKTFLRKFVAEFLDHMKARGDDRRCIFHISDEPHGKQIKQYLKSKAVIADLIAGYRCIDALSDVNFYKSGIIPTPVAATTHIHEFIQAFEEKGETGLWAYYCCGQNIGVSNRYFGMSGARTRFIGCQFYKYRIAGFLQWGYNFYNNQCSYDAINPYVDTTGNYFGPSGDMFSVYPGMDGSALESVRINYFREGLEDQRALQFCEKLIGREKTLEALEAITGDIVFHKCVNDSATMLKIRETIDALVAKNLK